MESNKSLIKTVPFSEVNLWDVKRFNYIFNQTFDNAVLLRDILTPFKQKVSKEEMIENNWQIIAKINFSGELFLREKEQINTYKGTLNKVPDNSIIYSKINVRHGCLYYHEKGKTPFGVSTEYPTFVFDNKKVNGYYLKRVLRGEEFKKLLNTKTSGISKARVKVDEFLDIRIPLPPIDEQNRIIENYNKKVLFAKEQKQKAKRIEREIEDYIFSELGIERNIGEGIKKGIQAVSFSTINKWSIDDIFKKNTIKSTLYDLVSIESVCSIITDGTHQTPKYFDEGVIFLSARNVTEEVIDWKKIKYVSQEAHEGYTKTVKPSINDILLAKNGTTGVAAIIEEDKEFSIYVSLALLRPIPEKILPNFLLRVINSDVARIQFFSRLIGIGVPNLHLGEIREVQIPLPPLPKQKEIASKIELLKQKRANLKIKSKQNLINALKEFEEEIFMK
ncbi:type I restriction enzyme S subunit [Cellulophaga sp. RHA_52]|uniref:restriction endonuclease subunit S n=1 Tax=Cellulophaga sp. RHA_52 TaxID=1250036 RepID=UPI00119C64E0|nr:restriction endonuclease subunit S [Cellulophaga sp. RHA_52]TVZ07844.1 type I restriction enzyme S subunit [Cellulophaga sp. RHA_52]